MASLAETKIASAIRNPALMSAALALVENRLHDAEPILKAHLKSDPFDVTAIRMLAELAGRIGRMSDAENLLRRAVEIAPTFAPARSNLALVLHRQGRPIEAIEILDSLLQEDDDDLAAVNLKAAASSRIGDFNEALALYEHILKSRPSHEKIWHSYGHVLKTVGRRDEGVAAYRKAVALRPGFGEAWWSLANIKTVQFADAELETMEAEIARPGIADPDRFHLDFALGKAFEDRKLWARSFAHYDAANRLRRESLDYDAGEQHASIGKRIAQATRQFFAERTGGCEAADPIFILGMPRAGSTLIEQILSSHSMIEGTQELPDIPRIASSLGRSLPDADARRRLGEEYISRTRIHRKTDKPYFIDKLPNNWQHIALIHTILPNAKIIDARRHPLDCCFSNFKQHFARGQPFTYGLGDVGEYYVDYVRYLERIDTVLPGRVCRVIHEELVENPEAEVRRLLDYLGVPFEAACLNFWQNERAVQTPSAEQVRRPINRDGMDRWRHYDEWLGPLHEALGAYATIYPAVPA